MATKQLHVSGPLWSATVDIVEQIDPRRNWAWRSLYLDRQPSGGDQLHLPGTLLVLCSPRRVTVRPDQASNRSYAWQRTGAWTDEVASQERLVAWLNSGELCLLLVEVDPADGVLPNDFPQAICLGGEIALDRMNEVGAAHDGLYGALGLGRVAEPELGARQGAAVLPGEISVHGSGLSLLAEFRLPWLPDPLSAPLWLQRPVVKGNKLAKSLRLSIEAERLTAEERRAIVNAWGRLGRALTPTNPLLSQAGAAAAVDIPQWVTLELANPLAVPNLYWQVEKWEQRPELCFGKGDFNLLLNDRQPYDQKDPPTSSASVAPAVRVSGGISADGTRESLLLRAEEGLDWESGSLSYQWSRDEKIDAVTLVEARLAFDPVGTARFLRQTQELPEPEFAPAREEDGEIVEEISPPDPALLWGFMPLADGWAQLPFFNLSEQLYLDAGLAQYEGQMSSEERAVFQGAVTFDNDDNRSQLQPPNEQPWSLTIVDVQALRGQWTVDLSDDEAGPILKSVTLECQSPQLVLSGLLWLSAGRPTVGDALPNLDDWIAGLRSIPLRTVDRGRELFPSPVIIQLDALSFARRADRSAQLGPWSWQYAADKTLLNETLGRLGLPAGLFSGPAPLAWRRHPALPMIQTLPLTQSQEPPNLPSASRQLIPYELPVADAEDSVPGWAFGVQEEGGAADWPVPLNELKPAAEWGGYEELSLASLSLPGLVLNASAGLDASDQTAGLKWQFRHDLPYLDEPNALAQLPKTPPDPAGETILKPEAAPPRPAEIWTRPRFARHWRRLAELSALAEADAVKALSNGDANTVMRYLVEPYEWPVDPAVDLAAYPGSVEMNGAGSEEPVRLEKEAALEGISGRFSVDENGRLALAPGEKTNAGESNDTGSNDSGADAPKTPTFLLRAGSMAAHRTDMGGYRDQRGLIRLASRKASPEPPAGQQASPEAHPDLYSTAVHYHDASGRRGYELVSLLAPLSLTVRAGGDEDTKSQRWQLWLRDLPLAVPEEATDDQELEGLFERAQVRSAHEEDINDPDARTAGRDFLLGYEWRLSGGPDSAVPLSLYGLDFYPLRMEKVVVAGGFVAEVVIAGRLQLPVGDCDEQVEYADLSNVLLVTFKAPGQAPMSDGALFLDDVSMGGEAGVTTGDWPLATEGGERIDAPRLLWSNAALKDSDTGRSLAIGDVYLQFHLFGARWSLPLGELTFPERPSKESPVTYEYPAEPQGGTGRSLSLRQVTFGLDLDNCIHSIDLALNVRLGRSEALSGDGPARPALGATIHAKFRCDEPGAWQFQADDIRLFDDIVPRNEAAGPVELHYRNKAFQFRWERYDEAEQGLQLLPGMHLWAQEDAAPGFATLTFEPSPAVPEPDEQLAVPELDLDSAHVEAILFARWGSFLQREGGPSEPGREQLFGSSAGNIALGYTAQWLRPASPGTAGTWDEDFMLNGFLEIKNLISWPAGLATSPNDGDAWIFPAHDAQDGLNQVHHTMRILLNQHDLPPELVVMRPGNLLFDLAAAGSLQFLAVVEHQLVAAAVNGDGQPLSLADERRWTAIQEIRVATPAAFDAFLDDHVGRETIDPLLLGGQDPFGHLISRSIPSKDPRNELDADKALIALKLGNLHQAPGDWTKLFTTVQIEESHNNWRDLPGGEWKGTFIQGKELVQWTVDLEDVDNSKRYRWLVRLSEQEPRPFIVSEPFELPGPKEIKFVEIVYPQDDSVLSAANRVVSFQQALGGFYGSEMASALKEAAGALPEGTLLVEASAHYWLNLRPNEDSGTTALQYLPGGTQSAILSGPEDFGPSDLREPAAGAPTDPPEPGWLLLTMPFLGRLQDSAADGLASDDTAGTESPNPLQVDPVLHLLRGSQASPEPLSLYLAHRGAGRSVSLEMSPIDSARGRRFSRLDTLSLQANWLRLHNLPEEPLTGRVASVMAALPDTPARLSRPIALQRAYDSARRELSASNEGTPSLQNGLAWESGRLLVSMEVRPPEGDESRLPGWPLTGVHLLSIPAGAAGDASSQRRFAAASLLPIDLPGPDKAPPVSLAVSPYLGLIDLKAPAGDVEPELRLISSELLCLDEKNGLLHPVTSRLWERRLFGVEGSDPTTDRERLNDAFEAHDLKAEDNEPVVAGDARWTLLDDAKLRTFDIRREDVQLVVYWTMETLRELIRSWASSVRKRLSPDTRVAVLRQREILENVEENRRPEEAVLLTRYRFALVLEESPAQMARRAFPLRAAISTLHFQEGQFGGHEMPNAIAPFELAPPQTSGVQPIYEIERPQVKAPEKNGVPEVAGAQNGENGQSSPNWPWGISALRYSVNYSAGLQGIVGPAPSAPGWPGALWWQAPQHAVQFRPAGSDSNGGDESQFENGLPPLFRAPAIKSYLPVLPRPPMPAVDAGDELGADGTEMAKWQPVLPGQLRYLLLGSRPGVMLAARHQLLRQTFGEETNSVMVSGSVPVQHRTPRPIPLPANPTGRPDKALRTWASYFEPEVTLHASEYPADEAFLAGHSDGATPARRLRMTLTHPVHGLIEAGWDREFHFAPCRRPSNDRGDWQVEVALVIDGERFPFEEKELEGDYQRGYQLFTGGPGATDLEKEKAQKLAEDLEKKLTSRRPGDTFLLQATVQRDDDDGNRGFAQTVSFPLRIGDKSSRRLPLRPMYIQFEDPEYNRRLASKAVQADGVMKSGGTSHPFTLAVDRAEYNPDGRMAMRVDWTGPRPATEPTIDLAFKRVNAAGEERSLTYQGDDQGNDDDKLKFGALKQISLLDLREEGGAANFANGETLKLLLTVSGKSLSLAVTIVDEPVIPVPEAAYALLRWRQIPGDESGAKQVECVRFAWAPEASRIEMVCAKDLQTGIVRRRAVFQWPDSFRPGTLSQEGYAIQKITMTGSTHFPNT